jgi:hypothetical protein
MMNQLSTNINIGPLIYVSRIETARNTDFAMLYSAYNSSQLYIIKLNIKK